MNDLPDTKYEVWAQEKPRSEAIRLLVRFGKENGLTAKAAARRYAIRQQLVEGRYVLCVAEPRSNYVATVDVRIKVKADCRYWAEETAVPQEDHHD